MLNNPYLDLLKQIHPTLSRNCGDIDSDFNVLKQRQELCTKYSWAIPDEFAIEKIANYIKTRQLSSIVEIGAGNGYWAYCLNQMGIVVNAFDSGGSHLNFKQEHWHPVNLGGIRSLQEFANAALFLCWPPMNTHKAKVAKKLNRIQPKWSSPIRDVVSRGVNMGGGALSRFKGNHVIYVGESCGGCTGDDRMWDILNKDFEEIDYYQLPNYPGINDGLYFFHRKL